MLRPLVFTLGLLTCCPLWAQADSGADYQAKLNALQHKMERLKKELATVKSDRDKLQKELQTSEEDIGSLTKKVERLNKELASQKKQLAQLKQERDELRQKKQQQQEQIARHINAAYRLGRQSQLKMVLNQQQPDTIARMMKYYDYFIDARADHIDAYLTVIANLNQLEPKITAKTEALANNQRSLKQRLEQLNQRQQQRQQTLAKLNQAISSKGQTLKQHEADRQRLERLLREVSQALADLALPDGGEGFAKRRGKLKWPTRGKILKRFGYNKGVGGLKWEGVLIGASNGREVTAIHHGRVVFADYLRGHGLLMIVDHGDGYLSLYAHNQSLLKDTGEWVNRGDLIAKVGNTGGQSQSALYFEIRHQGTPVNPALWCRS